MGLGQFDPQPAVEEDDDGRIELTIFSGPDAPDRAFQYADWRYRLSTQSHAGR
jgi:hypothetical protein